MRVPSGVWLALALLCGIGAMTGPWWPGHSGPMAAVTPSGQVAGQLGAAAQTPAERAGATVSVMKAAQHAQVERTAWSVAGLLFGTLALRANLARHGRVDHSVWRLELAAGFLLMAGSLVASTLGAVHGGAYMIAAAKVGALGPEANQIADDLIATSSDVRRSWSAVSWVLVVLLAGVACSMVWKAVRHLRAQGGATLEPRPS